MTTKKGGRPEDGEMRGTVQAFKDARGRIYYKARITLPDQERIWLKPRFDKRDRAEDYAAEKTAEAHRRKTTVAQYEKKKTAGESCDEYFARLSEVRESEGIVSVRKERYDWGKWVSPRIGTRPVAEVTRDEIEDVRNALDVQVKARLSDGLEAGISGSTAMNIWSTLRTTFKEAVSARDRALRVRTDDPASGHKPPLDTPERAKTFLYPNEMVMLLGCEDVPLEWRQTYAVGAYTFVRPEELEAVAWPDVDFAALTTHISKAVDARTGEPKPMPKNANAVRSVPIEPALLPLLKAMYKARASDDAPVCPVLREVNDNFRAQMLREHLRLAGVTRARLFADTPTLRPIDFRSLRDTGITWLALAKVPLSAMQRRVGHEDITQTNSYVKLGEDLSGSIGEPFPPIPESLFPSSKRRLSESSRAKFSYRRRDSNRGVVDPSTADLPEIHGVKPAEEPKPATANPANSGRLDSHLDAADSVEAALAKAIEGATAAGRFDVVSQLAKELETRRFARAKVIPFDVAKRRGR